MTRLPDQLGHCKKCGASKIANVEAFVPFSMTSGDEIDYYESHYILKCGVCHDVYHQIVYQNTGNLEFNEYNEPTPISVTENWPTPHTRRRPDWLSDLAPEHPLLSKVLWEIYEALDNNLHILTGIGIRTAFEIATEHLAIDPSLTFAEKLEELTTAGLIEKTEQADFADFVTLIDPGIAAAHRAWTPLPSDLDTLLNALEPFLHRNLVALSSPGRASSPRAKRLSLVTWPVRPNGTA